LAELTKLPPSCTPTADQLRRKMFYSLSNVFLSIRGQLNGFFFSLRISSILTFFGYYLWPFFKNEKIKMFFADFDH